MIRACQREHCPPPRSRSGWSRFRSSSTRRAEPKSALSFNQITRRTARGVKQQLVLVAQRRGRAARRDRQRLRVRQGPVRAVRAGGAEGARSRGDAHDRHRRFLKSDQIDRRTSTRSTTSAPTRAARGPTSCSRRRSTRPAASAIGKYAARGKQYLVMVRPIGRRARDGAAALSRRAALVRRGADRRRDGEAGRAQARDAAHRAGRAATSSPRELSGRGARADARADQSARSRARTSRSRRPRSPSTRSSTSWRRSRRASPPASREARAAGGQAAETKPAKSKPAAKKRAAEVAGAMKAYSTREVADLLGLSRAARASARARRRRRPAARRRAGARVLVPGPRAAAHRERLADAKPQAAQMLDAR